MSIDITIKQNGLLKKSIKTETILGGNLKAGIFDGMCMDRNAVCKNEFIVYNPEFIGRGVSVWLDKSRKNEVFLRLLTPTSNEEIQDFCNCVVRIMNDWNCTLIVDGAVTSLSEFQRRAKKMADFNVKSLREMANRILSGEDDPITLPSAFFPLSVGKEEAKRFLQSETCEEFSRWLHEKQSIDAYYAKPEFSVEDNEIIGKYIFTEGKAGIFPVKGYVPFGIINKQTNKPLKCEKFIVSFCCLKDNTILGTMGYDKFIENLNKGKVHKFDSTNLLIDPISSEELKNMLNID